MKNEKGQALPLAIIALTIGALLVVPFLVHASISMIGSRTYGSTIDYRNACDAGVEQGIWRLAYGNLAPTIPNPGDHITYQLAEAINGITPSITVTTNTTGEGAGSLGIITGKIDSYEFDTSNCYEPEIEKISGSVYVTAYRGPSNRGYLKTYSIADNGIITHTIISTYTFDSTACYTPDIIHVSGTVYAIAYRYTSGSTNRGYLKTVNIANTGVITQSVIDSLTFESSGGYEPSIVQVSGVYYAIAYRNSSNRGILKTVTIAANGDIGNSVIDTLTFDSSAGYQPKMIQASGSVFAIAYQGYNTLGYLKTVNIAANGDIGSSTISSLVTDTAECLWPDIIKISDTVYAIIFTCVFNWPDLKTVNIAANGIISQTMIDDAEYVNGALLTPRIIHISGDIYMTCGQGDGNCGTASTVTIADDGRITNWALSTFVFDTSYGYETYVIQVSTNVVAIVYRGSGNDGYVVTLGILLNPGTNTYTIVASAGTTSIRAYIILDGAAVSIISWKLT
jgi:hypothetical protein